MIKVSNRWSEEEQAVITILRSYRGRVSKYKTCIRQCEELYPSTTASYDSIGGSGSGENKTEQKIHSILDMRAQMHRDLDRQLAQIRAIEEWLESLEPDEYTVIIRRYVLYQNMDKISMDTHCSVRNCWRFHYHGLQHLIASRHTLAHKLD